MRRKIIKQGNNTLTITLPSEWARRYNLQAGNEIELEERGKSLILRTDKKSNLEQCSMSISNLDPMLRRTLFALYLKGYEEISLTFNSAREMDIIQSSMNEIIGMEVIDQVKNTIIIKELAHPEYSEFDNILRKTFLLLLNTSKETLSAWEKGDYDYLDALAQTDKNVNKFTNFCRRTLVKNDSYDFRKSSSMFLIVAELEKIGDLYRDICLHIAKNKFKTNKEVHVVFEDVNNFLHDFYDIFYKFELKKLRDMSKSKERLDKEIESLFGKASKKEMKILFQLSTISEITFDMTIPLLIINL